MAVTDLTGTTWIFNEILTAPSDMRGWDVNFTSNNLSFYALVLDGGELRYVGNQSVDAYYTGWAATEYRTIAFTGGDEVTNTDLISWLQTTAVLQVDEYFTCTDELTSIADAIRAKGSTSASLAYPDGFVTAINNLPTKVLGLGVIGQDTPFDIQVTAQDYSDGNWDGFSFVNVSIETPFYDGSCDIINPVSLITFTITDAGRYAGGSDTFQAEEGMTWGEWVDSSYNTSNFRAPDYVWLGNRFFVTTASSPTYSYAVSPSDIITSTTYYLIDSGSVN